MPTSVRGSGNGSENESAIGNGNAREIARIGRTPEAAVALVATDRRLKTSPLGWSTISGRSPAPGSSSSRPILAVIGEITMMLRHHPPIRIRLLRTTMSIQGASVDRAEASGAVATVVMAITAIGPATGHIRLR